MNSPSGILPPQFSELEAFADWALPTETARRQKRLNSSMDEIESFYRAVLPRLEEVLEYLNDFPLVNLKGPEKRLMDLTLSLAEVSAAMELYGRPDHPFGIELTRFVIGHE